MIQPIIWFNGGLFATGGPQVANLLDGGRVASGNNPAAESSARLPMPVAGTFRNFRWWQAGPIGAGNSWIWTIYKRTGGTSSATSLAVTLDENSQYGEDLTDSAHFDAGDYIFLHSDPISGPGSNSDINGAIDFEPDDGVSTIYGKFDTQSFAAAGTVLFHPLFGWSGQGDSPATANEAMNVMPCAGEIDVWYISSSGNTGASTGRDWYICVNGVRQDGTGGTVDTKIAATGSGNNVWSKTGMNLSLTAGDRVHVESVVIGGIATHWLHSFAFVPTIAGQSMMGCAAPNHSLSSGVTRYQQLTPPISTAQTVEAAADQQCRRVATFSNFHVWRSAAPGGSAAIALTIRKNGADTALSVTLGSGDTSGSDSDAFLTALDDLIAVKLVNTNAPAAGVLAWSVVVPGIVDETESPHGSPLEIGITGLIEMCFGGSYRALVKRL